MGLSKNKDRGPRGPRGFRGTSFGGGSTARGIPTGGAQYDVLMKSAAANYSTEWATIFSGLRKITVSASQPSSPQTGDLWIDTSEA